MPPGDPAEFYAALPRKRCAAGVLFVDESDRVLLVEPTYKAYWDLPGGAVELDEPPAEGARREIAEELGLAYAPGQLLCVDWVPSRPIAGDALLFVFDGGPPLTPEDVARIVLPPDELADFAFVAVGDLDGYARPRLVRRISACLTARATGVPVYLEDAVLRA